MIAQAHTPVNAKILLASASPRRRELIKLLGLPVETTSADIDETPLPHENAFDLAKRLSEAKAHKVFSEFSLQPSTLTIILASDTVVSLDGKPINKPIDAADARSMLRHLRNRSHQVFTAITLLDVDHDRSITDVGVSDVPMRNYTDSEIEAYIASGDPFDKAGAYAIQHAGFHPVDRFSDCFANVMGLPLCHILRALNSWQIHIPNNVPVACQNHIHYQCPVFEEILAANK